MLHTLRGCRGFERFDVPRFPHRRRQAQADDFAFFPAPEAGHQKNVRANAGVAQGNRFIERSHAQPLCAFGFERARALDGAVAVGVGLHHRADGNARSHVLLHGAKILPQRGERNFRPGGTRRHAARDFCSAGHFRDYSGSERARSGYARATPGCSGALQRKRPTSRKGREIWGTRLNSHRSSL